METAVEMWNAGRKNAVGRSATRVPWTRTLPKIERGVGRSVYLERTRTKMAKAQVFVLGEAAPKKSPPIVTNDGRRNP